MQQPMPAKSTGPSGPTLFRSVSHSSSSFPYTSWQHSPSTNQVSMSKHSVTEASPFWVNWWVDTGSVFLLRPAEWPAHSDSIQPYYYRYRVSHRLWPTTNCCQSNCVHYIPVS